MASTLIKAGTVIAFLSAAVFATGCSSTGTGSCGTCGSAKSAAHCKGMCKGNDDCKSGCKGAK